MEALIREVIKGQGGFFWGVEECFIAAARFLTSLQMSSVDTGVSTPSLLWVNLTLVQPAEKCLCLEKLFMGAGSQIPNVWEEELLQISPRCCNMWIFYHGVCQGICRRAGSGKQLGWERGACVGWRDWRFQRTSVPRQVRVQGCAHKAGVDNPIVRPYLSSRD